MSTGEVHRGGAAAFHDFDVEPFVFDEALRQRDVHGNIKLRANHFRHLHLDEIGGLGRGERRIGEQRNPCGQLQRGLEHQCCPLVHAADAERCNRRAKRKNCHKFLQAGT